MSTPQQHTAMPMKPAPAAAPEHLSAAHQHRFHQHLMVCIVDMDDKSYEVASAQWPDNFHYIYFNPVEIFFMAQFVWAALTAPSRHVRFWS
jgi:hypothetical protein